MIKLFNSNKILVSVLYIPILLLLTGIDFQQGSIIPSTKDLNLVAGFILKPFYAIPILYQYIITVVVIFIQLMLLTYISTKHQLQKSTNLLVGLFYIIFLAFMPQTFLLNEGILANFFIIGSIDQVLESYKKHKAYGNIVNAGLFIGLASLFSPILILLFIWAFIGILRLRSFKGTERLLLFLASLIPYYLLGSWLFFNGNFTEFFNKQLLSPFGPLKLLQLEQKELITILMLIAASIVLIFNFRNYMIKRNMVVQRKISNVFFLFMLSLGLKFFLGLSVANYTILLAIPMSIFSAILCQMGNYKWAELVTILLIANVLCLRIDFILKIFGLN